MEEHKGDIEQYIEDFEAKCEELGRVKLEDAPPISFRKHKADQLIEEYFEKMGRVPNSLQLNHLANYILVDDLKNVDSDKVTNTEYPILSTTQLKRRTRKQSAMLVDTLDYLNSKFNKRLDSLSRRITESWTE